MSAPISVCLIFKAAKGDEEAYQLLLDKTIYNLGQMAYTQFSCRCEPPCEHPPAAKLEALQKRLNADVAKYKEENYKPFEYPAYDKDLKILVPAIRKLMPTLMAEDIVGVQPMSADLLKDFTGSK